MSKTTPSETLVRKDFTTTIRPFSLACPHCTQEWEGTNLTKIAKRIAWHWNSNHNDELTHTQKPRIDTVERGGHNTVDNQWAVERIPIHLTAFDVLEERLGKEDGWATVSDKKSVCQECLRETPEGDARIVIDDSGYHEKWRCQDCFSEQQLKHRRETNRALSEFENTD